MKEVEVILTWWDRAEALEAEGWEPVKYYSLTGRHHEPTAFMVRGVVDAADSEEAP